MSPKGVRLVLAALLALAAMPGASAQWNPANPVTGVERREDGLLFRMKEGALSLQVRSPSIIRVCYSPAAAFTDGPEYVILKPDKPHPAWRADSVAGGTRLRTDCLNVFVSWNDGSITFSDTAGRKLFEDYARTLSPVEVNGEKTYHAELFSDLWGSSEGFFGLGQHQAGVWNYRGESVDISQDNTNIGIPFFISTAGYGIYWHNTSRSRFNNRFLNALYLSSEVADAVDYYFIAGPELDQVIAGYRSLTGDAPMFGRWAYGFWQCKNRYKSEEEILSVARRYRASHIPVDNIVQDWFWWNTMGEPVFDRSRYPDPEGMIRDLHGDHFHLMISVWPFFRPGSGTYEEMDRRGYFAGKTVVGGFHPAGQALYDAFNHEASEYYWHLIDTSLFRIGVDAWWLDTTEPETEGRETNILVTSKTSIGSGARYVNLYPLMTTSAVYRGQRSAGDRKRVFILSRSAFAGSQRFATAVWSGDINSDWTFLRKQIPAGLNYSLSGLPYWTTDTGGFLTGDPGDSAYRELFVRWFQFSTFTPILRVHGTRTNDQNELWSYGPAAEKILVAFDRLRYRLIPYIYSLAWMTTNAGYTPMRPLVMDFRTDSRAAGTGDQFMFGPAILVSPVTEPSAGSRRLYLPSGRWYDFWTGKAVNGGRSIEGAAPLERLPLLVRGGSIIPLGPEMEWTGEKSSDTLEIRVYRGASCRFTLYEDEGDNYDYEKGSYSLIPFTWDEHSGRLTVGTRRGKYPGMNPNRTFRLVFVRSGHGTGGRETPRPDVVARYRGSTLTFTPR